MPPPAIQHVYIRLAANHQLELFSDVGGTTPLDAADLPVRGNGMGWLQFNFILNRNPGHHNGHIETADLIIIPQTKQPTGGARTKDSPFHNPATRVFFLADPANLGDPGNLSGTTAAVDSAIPDATSPSGFIQYIPVPDRLRIKHVAPGQAVPGPNDGPYKYTIIAISDDGADFDAVDPTIVINP